LQVRARTDVGAERFPDDRPVAVHEQIEPLEALGPLRERLALQPKQLRRTVDPSALPFESTAEVEPLVGTIGQPRALDAIDYALDVETRGFNLFVSGVPGSGRLTTVLDYVRSRARTRQAPDDWVCVHNFASPDQPKAIRLPAGRGRELAHAMDEFMAAAGREIRRALDSDEYERGQREVLADANRKRRRLEGELEQFASSRSYALTVTPAGVTSVPLVEGDPITREQFSRLPEPERRRIESAGAELAERTVSYVRQLHLLEKGVARRIEQLDHEVALYATGPLFHELEERFAGEEAVLGHLAAVRDDLLAHLSDFRENEERSLVAMLRPARDDRTRFRVNLLVDNSQTDGAPVVVEHNPTYYNLLGRIEYHSTFGAMVTDFRDVKAGALHRANGGFLLLDLMEVLRHPFAWDVLKRALRSGEIRIENLGEEFSAIPSATLRPEPVPLDVKVVLLGPPTAYRLLYQLDDDFRELFKVKADFAPELDWNPEHEQNYAAFISRWVRDNGLRHFDRDAVARVIEYGGRLRDSQRKLSARLIEVSDLVSEASFWAGKLGHGLVQATDVELAQRKREYRSNLLEERVRELIERGTLVITTDGVRVGEVNGLSMLQLGDYEFGRPTRISARVSLGRGGVESIEREIDLSGPIHSKGVLILTGFLAATYAQHTPLALRATLAFEQAYDEVEGDSASSAELYALLSALAETPIDQSIAVTGSVDQCGRIQAVGGVTRKIEGFYAVCKAQGFTSRQGVAIPAANVPDLMLDEEVVDAVRGGQFHIWAISTIDQGLELLTGLPAGVPAPDGRFEEETIHARVAAKLDGYAHAYQRFAPDGSTRLAQ
jgi:lon-related putative ATP-dependent protease